MAEKNKRRKAVVDAHVQWTLAGRVVMHFFAFICGGAFFGLIFQFLSNPLGSLTDHLVTFWRQSAPMLVAMLCLVPVFIRDTLTLSNRIAGPICRMRSTIKRIGDGESVPPLSFRKNDMWDDLPALFNRMMAQRNSSEAPSLSAADGDQDGVEAASPASDQQELVEV